MGDGPAEKVALCLIAVVNTQKCFLLDRFDAFGDDGEAQGLAHRNDRFGDRHVFGIMRNRVNEGTVDLERVDREALELRQRRVAGAEIVDGHAHAHGLDGAELLGRPSDIAHHHAFCDFELEQFRGHARILQHGDEVLQPIFVGELARRQVDRHAHGRQARTQPGDILCTRSLQHPLADRNDQSRSLQPVG